MQIEEATSPSIHTTLYSLADLLQDLAGWPVPLREIREDPDHRLSVTIFFIN